MTTISEGATSRTHPRRVSEVSRFKKCDAIGYKIQRQGLPIGDAAGPHSFSILFCEFVILHHPFSIASTTSQLFSDHLSSSQFSHLFSTALKVVPSRPTSAQLFSPLPCSSQLFSTLLNDSHLCPPCLNSSQVVSTLLTSCHLFYSHLLSPALNSSHLFLSSSQLFSPWPTLLNSSPPVT